MIGEDTLRWELTLRCADGEFRIAGRFGEPGAERSESLVYEVLANLLASIPPGPALAGVAGLPASGQVENSCPGSPTHSTRKRGRRKGTTQYPEDEKWCQEILALYPNGAASLWNAAGIVAQKARGASFEAIQFRLFRKVNKIGDPWSAD